MCAFLPTGSEINSKKLENWKSVVVDPPLSYSLVSKKNYDDDEKILEILNEVSRDIKNYELEFRIAELESKFSKDLSEITFNELKELKKQQNIN